MLSTSGPIKVIILFSCSTQQSMKLKLLIKTEIGISGLNHQSQSDIYHALKCYKNAILTFMSRINVMVS